MKIAHRTEKRLGLLFIILGVLCFGPSDAAPIRQIVLIGNSITLHSPEPDIGWTGNWGMAASRAHKDYVHDLARIIKEHQLDPVRLVVLNLSAIEKGSSHGEIHQLDNLSGGQGSYAIVFLGDNVTDDKDAIESFAGRYGALLASLQQRGFKHLFCVSTWWTNPAKNYAIKSVCTQHYGQYIPLDDIAKKPENHAYSERHFKLAGVGNHPGNLGMQKIAQRIYSYIAKR